ncbi:substrate-binding and VWA domain-containing protein [Micromonospora sp. DT47]|uniref:substrate-binding and VWA domain-containing protein n=1 Tax=Micromonospora sp. DT47 TaxID=3393431 RepID=UPI003CE93607
MGRHDVAQWWRFAGGSPLVRRLAGTSPVALLSALLVVVLVAWAGVAYLNSLSNGPSCAEQVPVRLAVAPVLAPAIEQIAKTAGDRQPCVSITVEARRSISVAANLVTPEAGQAPDAWLPESTFWLRRARSTGAFEVPERGTSVGSSPVVLALTEPVADRLGWPAKQVNWAALVGPDARDVAVGIPDPAEDSAGVAALLGMRALAAGEPEPAAAVTAAMRRIAPNTLTVTADAGAVLPTGAGVPERVDAFATTEQAVIRHNSLARANKLVAAYAGDGVPTLDLPYVVLPGARGPVREAATGFLDVLLSPSARATLVAQGFRTAGGFPPEGVPTDGRVRLDVRGPVAMPPEETLTELLNGWSGVRRSARILTVLDTSGSMAARVPDTNETRMSATIKAAQDGAGLLLDSSEIGLWVFSTRLDGDLDYREVLSVGPLREQREELVAGLGEVRVKPNGGTGLYDTALAAYREARQHWTPGRINLVLIMTDGQNEDADSIGRDQLLAELAKLQDPQRPLPILFIGLGSGVDRAELEGIAAATRGRVFLTKQPGGIRKIFFSALAGLSCLPPECRR